MLSAEFMELIKTAL